jgi:itaconyl-CoA hydratase
MLRTCGWLAQRYSEADERRSAARSGAHLYGPRGRAIKARPPTSMEYSMAVKVGWPGRVYEDFEVGDIYVHPLGRTVLSVDNTWFTLLTQNMNAIHFDHAYAAQTEFGRPLVDSTFTLALVTGQSVIDLSLNVMANLGWDEVRLPNPVFEGDTIYSRSEVLDKRESKSRSNVGIVRVKTTGFKQDGTIVIEFLRTFMVYKRGHVPASVRARIPEPKR